MSVESDFRALLAGNAGVTALVGTRIAKDATEPPADESAPVYPLIVFSARHSPILGMDRSDFGEQVTLTVQCWAETGEQATAVADAVSAAVLTAPAASCATVIDQTTAFDEETDLDAVVLTVEWWAV